MDKPTVPAFRPRALSSADFSELFRSPKRARSRHFSLFWRDRPVPGLGMVASKKLAGNAIRRNLVKRHAREVFRACCAHVPQGPEVVIRVTADIRGLSRADQFAEISDLFARSVGRGRDAPA